MKKLAAAMTVAVFAVVLVGSSARAMGGPKGGFKFALNFGKVGGDFEDIGADESRFGIAIGGTVDIPITDTISLQTGLAYTQKGAEGTIDGGVFVPAWVGVPVKAEAEFDYFEIPFLARFSLADGKAYADAGLGIGFNTKAEAKLSAMGSSGTLDFEDDANNEFSIIVGFGASVPAGNGTFSAGIQYALGLTDVLDIDDPTAPQEGKSRTLSIMIGATF